MMGRHRTTSRPFYPSQWRPLLTTCALSALLLVVRPSFGQTQPVDLDALVQPPAGSSEQEGAPPVAATGTVSRELPESGTAVLTSVPPVALPMVPAPLPVSLLHPEAVNSAEFSANGQTVRLFGVIGVGGEGARGLKAFIAGTGDSLTCTPQTAAEYTCLLPNGTDIAMVALVNGAAQTRTDASDAYRQQETAAQAARRGIWVNLPAPPVLVKHPVVRDTATLEADNAVYLLDGIEGVSDRPALELQGFIAANGDAVTCQQQGASSYYICLMPDGTDLAKIVLVNGAAHVAGGAADAYRIQQREAIANHRGIWPAMAPAQIARYETPPPLQDNAAFALEAGPEAEGITYVGGQPTALVDGEVAFLVFGGVAGWGYYDHFHHWRGAPERFGHHLEHFHPEGRGLRGYGPGGMRETHLRGEEFRSGGLRNASLEHRGEVGHAGFADRREVRGPEVAGRPEAGRPAFAGRPEVGRPGLAAQQTNRLAMAQPRPAVGAATGLARQPVASPVAVRPGGAAVPAARAAAPAFRAAAPAPRAAAPAPPAKHK
jgi:endonuclease YncB( thermonuclease family)